MPRLPGDPSLEHLKSQAKTLLAGGAQATSRRCAGCASTTPIRLRELKLADAQLVVARAYGFASWPKLHAHLDVVERFRRSPHAARARRADPGGRVPAARVPDVLAGRPRALGGGRARC